MTSREDGEPASGEPPPAVVDAARTPAPDHVGGGAVHVRDEACAKVNLTLRILGRRPDGYHELQTLIAFAGISDTVSLTAGTQPAVTVAGAAAAALVGTNIVATALARLAAADPHLRLGSVHIDKRLPVAAGLGGGSADAAAALRAVRSLNAERAGGLDWHDLARGLGADVPACLEGRPLWATGLGERLTLVEQWPAVPVVLANPMASVPSDKTRQVFHALAAAPLPSAHATAPATPPAALPTRFAAIPDIVALMRTVGNDLAVPATTVIPAIADVLAELSATRSCLATSLSGAGPTGFAVYPTETAAEAAASALRSRRPGWWIAATTLG
ncbi:MAG: 4-(cytidine 5'-diphospho)-2-C-methyl-D-erythritol kinase [Hyphomicrobiaceae bacterium]|nr:4-(cytidine 5'-diphospho)-2-C-methyl-D-erythritol kinase [Hyphomicrobiaceae bacterium]